MGLDTVELVMAIEQEFGIEIPDPDAERMITVGDVYEYLKTRLKSEPVEGCLRQRIFYKLRRAVIENYNLPREALSPDTCLSEIMYFKHVEEGWPFLQMFIDLRIPQFQSRDEFLGWHVSDKTLKLRDIVDQLVSLNKDQLGAAANSDESIWQRLVTVTVNQLNVTRDQVIPSASFTRDLGAD